jgi:hypothetical protein
MQAKSHRHAKGEQSKAWRLLYITKGVWSAATQGKYKRRTIN